MKIKWEDAKNKCPWRMWPLRPESDVCQCAALRGTGMGCCESACAPWYFLKAALEPFEEE